MFSISNLTFWTIPILRFLPITEKKLISASEPLLKQPIPSSIQQILTIIHTEFLRYSGISSESVQTPAAIARKPSSTDQSERSLVVFRVSGLLFFGSVYQVMGYFHRKVKSGVK